MTDAHAFQPADSPQASAKIEPRARIWNTSGSKLARPYLLISAVYKKRYSFFCFDVSVIYTSCGLFGNFLQKSNKGQLFHWSSQACSRVSWLSGWSVVTMLWITHIQAYMPYSLMNHQKNHQTSPMAQWDSLDVLIVLLGLPSGPPRAPLDPLGPLCSALHVIWGPIRAP